MSVSTSHHASGNVGRQLWLGASAGLVAVEETPLQRDAIKHYAIAHADDVSNLIVHWGRALVVVKSSMPLSTANVTMSIGLGWGTSRWRLRDGKKA